MIMQALSRDPLRVNHDAPRIEALLPAAGAMTTLCIMLLALLFVI